MDRPNLGSKASFDSLLGRIVNAYRQGFRLKPLAEVVLPFRSFDNLRFLGTLGWIPLKSRLMLRRLRTECNKCLAAARQGHISDSHAYCEVARECLGLLGDAPLAKYLGSSTYFASAAYLDYRDSDFKQAYAHLEQAMDADLALESAGLPVMQVHRIQQGYNLMLVELRSGHYDLAIRLAGALWSFMEGRIDNLPYHRAWRSRSLWAVSRSLLRLMMQQIVGEMGSRIVINERSDDLWRMLVEVSHLSHNPEVAVFPQMQYAVWAQCRRLEGDFERYILSLEKFFNGGMCHCPSLWLSTLVEFSDFCLEMDSPCARLICESIRRDLSKCECLPSSLRNHLNLSVPAENLLPTRRAR